MQTFTVPELFSRSSGIGLRAPHHEEMLQKKPPVGWLEVHSENFFYFDTPQFKELEILRQDYPVSLHGVGLSLGSADGIEAAHVEKIRQLAEHIAPAAISEHISWSRIDGISVPDLLPLPLTQEAMTIICNNIDNLQNALQRPVMVENPSSYLAFSDSEMGEPEFLAEISARTGCGLLLDVNNIYVSAHNTGFDAEAYLRNIPAARVGEIHLAGYQINPVDDDGEIFIDAHNQPVHAPVWDLYEKALGILGDQPTLIEWDNDLPSLNVLRAEADRADEIRQKVLTGESSCVA